jgi:hypothetical protein
MGMPISCVKIRKIQPARASPNFSWIDCFSFYFVSAQSRNLRISLRGTPFPPDADSLASSAACPGQGKIWGFAPSGFLSGFPYKSTPKHAKARSVTPVCLQYSKIQVGLDFGVRTCYFASQNKWREN